MERFKQTKIVKKDFIGTWRIVKMSEWDNDYVNEEVKAFIKIESSGSGEFHFAFVQGSMFGDFEKLEGDLIYDFTFEGNEQYDQVSGDGWMKINADRTGEGELRFYAGDKSKFWAKKKAR